MLLTRRSLFGGVAAVLAAPAIVRAGSLMPVKAFGGYEVGLRPGAINLAPPLTSTEVRVAFFAEMDKSIEAQLAPRRDAVLQAIQRHLAELPNPA